ncbi:MAG: hypothetical protein J0I12_14790 [Candidatus Eremiobacteraeota bacterium]|mgnify:CR=1 FL=1|nr:hypothetical protein [Candidatus Eremiobacteraeota bacterium]
MSRPLNALEKIEELVSGRRSGQVDEAEYQQGLELVKRSLDTALHGMRTVQFPEGTTTGPSLQGQAIEAFESLEQCLDELLAGDLNEAHLAQARAAYTSLENSLRAIQAARQGQVP